jgi:hypothetical protein
VVGRLKNDLVKHGGHAKTMGYLQKIEYRRLKSGGDTREPGG